VLTGRSSLNGIFCPAYREDVDAKINFRMPNSLQSSNRLSVPSVLVVKYTCGSSTEALTPARAAKFMTASNLYFWNNERKASICSMSSLWNVKLATFEASCSRN